MKALRGAVIGVLGLLMMIFSLTARGVVSHEAFALSSFIATLLVFVGLVMAWRGSNSGNRRSRSRRM